MRLTINRVGQVIDIKDPVLIANASFLDKAYIDIVLGEDFSSAETNALTVGSLSVIRSDGFKVLNLLMVKREEAGATLFRYEMANESSVLAVSGTLQISAQLKTDSGKTLATIEQAAFVQRNAGITSAEEYDSVKEELKAEVYEPLYANLNELETTKHDKEYSFTPYTEEGTRIVVVGVVDGDARNGAMMTFERWSKESVNAQAQKVYTGTITISDDGTTAQVKYGVPNPATGNQSVATVNLDVGVLSTFYLAGVTGETLNGDQDYYSFVSQYYSFDPQTVTHSFGRVDQFTFSEMNRKIEKNESEIGDLQRRVSVNERNIISNTTSIQNNTSQIDTLETAVTEHDEAIVAQSDQITDLGNRATAIENAGYITKFVNDLVEYYKKTETYTREEINQLISNIKSPSISVVETLPETGDSSVFYLVKKEGSENDIYDEYIYVGGKWERIGSTAINLADYYTKTEIDSFLSRKVGFKRTRRLLYAQEWTLINNGDIQVFIGYNSLKSVKIYPTNASAAEYLRCGVVCTKLEQRESDSVLTMECEEIPTKNIEIIIEVIV